MGENRYYVWAVAVIFAAFTAIWWAVGFDLLPHFAYFQLLYLLLFPVALWVLSLIYSLQSGAAMSAYIGLLFVKFILVVGLFFLFRNEISKAAGILLLLEYMVLLTLNSFWLFRSLNRS